MTTQIYSVSATQSKILVDGVDVVTIDKVGGITKGSVQQMPVLGTAQNTTSGTAIDFTSIPPWVKRITVMFGAVSTNGTSPLQVQIGDSGGIETTGYVCAAFNISAQSDYTTGFGLQTTGTAAIAFHGALQLTLLDAATNLWIATGGLSSSGSGNAWSVSGSKALSTALDRVRISAVNGTDTFDAGSVNILYE